MTLKNVWGVSLKGINDLEDEVLVPPESRFRVTHVDSKSDPNYSSGYGGCGMDFITLEMENPDIYKKNFYKNTGVPEPTGSGSDAATIIIIVVGSLAVVGAIILTIV